VLTGFIMIVLFLVTVTVFTSKNFRLSFVPKLGMIFIGVVLAWGYTVNVSGGQIENRYTGVNARGVEKEDLSSGRGDLIGLEVQAFMENPILGIGAGMVKYYRAKKTGIEAASHNELSRLIAEQGIIGILSILLLLVVPLFYRLGNKSNVYFYCFMAFWGATINHSAMRIAAPSMLYGLALLRFEQPTKKLKRNEEEPDELIELMREKKLLPKRRVLPELP
jgi:hypothetical protein